MMSNDKPTITVLTPVWQGMPYIEEAINSVLNQELTQWELIISDNGSTDGTREYLDTLNDPRIRVYKQEKNLGAIGNLHFLLKKASAPICQILNHDDYLTDTRALTRIVDYWQNAPEDISFASHHWGNMKDTPWTRFLKKTMPTILHPEESDLWFFVFGNMPGNTTEVSVRKGFVERIGGFREDLNCESDYEFWGRAATSEAMGFIIPPAVYVREHPGQATFYLNTRGEFISELVEVKNLMYNRLIKKFPESRFALKLYGTLVLQMHLGVRHMLRGNFTFFREVKKAMEKADFLAPHPFRWGVYLFSFGGKVGKQALAKYVLRKSGLRPAPNGWIKP